MLKDKNIVIGVTGSIAAYKAAELVSSLVKLRGNVTVVMTRNAANFINPITFETLTGNKCLTDTFDRNFQYNVEHVALAKRADILLIAPASANIIGKIANGIADDMLSTVVMACRKKIMLAPAMNTDMFRNPIVQDNLNKLRSLGYEIIEPDSGYLACGDVGEGKLPAPQTLLEYILKEAAYEKDMTGLNVLVTAGATREAIDPVRFISNHSTGKMGYAFAQDAVRRGASVTLVSAKTALEPLPFVKIVNVQSAAEMFEAVKEAAGAADIVVKAAAVADYRPKAAATEKIKKKEGDAAVELERTDDILGYLGMNKREGQFLCGFSMETENLIENSSAKLKKKNLDMIIANNLKDAGAGFGTDTNLVTIITDSGCKDLPLLSKEEVAHRILTEILEKRK